MKLELDDTLIDMFKSLHHYNVEIEPEINTLIEEYLKKRLHTSYLRDYKTNVFGFDKFKADLVRLHKEKAAIVLYNICGTKQINDHYGFPYTDNLIAEVGHSLMNELGKDEVYRFRGDSFCSFNEKRPEKKISSKAEIRRSVIKKRETYPIGDSPFQKAETIMDFVDFTEYGGDNPYFEVVIQEIV